MKRFSLFLFTVAVLCWSCKKNTVEDQPQASEPIVTGTEILTQTITPQGGTISVEQFTLVIPSGAFSSDVTLSISRLDASAFSEDAKTPVYFVNGLPANFAQDLVISLSGLNVSDSLKTFLAEPVLMRPAGKVRVGYSKISHVTDNGLVKVVIPAAGGGSLKSAGDAEGSISEGVVAASNSVSFLSTNKHFEVTCPSSVLVNAITIADRLDEAYTMFSTEPFSFDFTKRSNWPLQVTLLSIPKENGKTIFGAQVTSKRGGNYNWLEINADELGNLDEIKLTAVHEFVHIIQGWYDPRMSVTQALFIAPHLWVDEAVAIWAEELFTPQGYISTFRNGLEMQPFAGGFNESRNQAAAEEFGYGMSAMIKYLVAQQGKGILKQIYDNILAGYIQGEAIRLALSLGYRYWFGDMIKEYTLGNIYPDMSLDKLFSNRSDKWAPVSLADTVITFTASYKQLGSKIYTLNFNPSLLSDNSVLEVRANQDQYQQICVFKYKTSALLEFVGQDPGALTVSNLSSLVKDGYKFLLVTTNLEYDASNSKGTPNTNEMSLGFTVKLKTQKDYKALSWIMMPAVLAQHFDKYGNLIESETTSFGAESLDSVPCTRNGNVLTASYPSSFDGTITITIKPDNTLDFTVSYQSVGAYVTENLTCSATGIPFMVSLNGKDSYLSWEAYPQIQSFTARSDESNGDYTIYTLVQEAEQDYGIVISLFY